MTKIYQLIWIVSDIGYERRAFILLIKTVLRFFYDIKIPIAAIFFSLLLTEIANKLK